MIIMCAWAFCGLLLGVVEVTPHRLLELGEDRSLELARRDVDLDVELRELGLEVVVGDQLEHVRVGQRRVPGLLGEVELDLEPDRAPVGVEARLAQHPLEDVEAELDLVAVALTVLAAEGGVGDLIAHGASFRRVACSLSATRDNERRERATTCRSAATIFASFAATGEESQAIRVSVGLTGDFWRLV